MATGANGIGRYVEHVGMPDEGLSAWRVDMGGAPEAGIKASTTGVT